MTTYRATNATTGQVVEYDAAAPNPEHLLAGWRLEDVSDAVAAVDAPPPVVPPVRITKLAFRNRFTPAEKVAIEMAALDNPAAPMGQRQLAAALRADMADQRDATHINLSRSDTRAGVHKLEQAGLIGPGRAAAILDTPPTAEELWNGN